MKRIQLLTIAFLFFAVQCFSQTLPSFVKDSIDGYVTRALSDWKIPGVAVCMVKDGKVVFMKGYGVRELGTTDKVDENTLFMIGSNTKAFTATIAAILDSEKKITLDDKVQKWLPDFKLHDPWVAKEANVRDLLCHRLGFETFQGDFMFFDSDLTKDEVIVKFGKIKPLYSFRGRWGYTNAAFGVAGEVIHKATQKTWAENIREKIFLPLGMTRSLATSGEIHSATNKASAHTVDNGILKKVAYGKIDNIAPAGAISSSVSDMSKWVMMQLDSGKMNGKQLIPAEALAETWTPHSILGNGGARFNTAHFGLYGLGWFIEEYNGKKIVAHTGGVNGFVTSVAMVPEEKLAIIVLTNTDANNFFEGLRMEIMDAWMGLPYRNYSRIMLDEQNSYFRNRDNQMKLKRDTINAKPKTALALSAYAGKYKHDIYGNMTIAVEKNELIMRFEHHKNRFSKLEALGENRFLSTWNDPLYGVRVLPFTVENGKVKSITVRVADFVEFTPYEFMKVE
jgi:CubicO group peptidase (beta-lactamase class C family)